MSFGGWSFRSGKGCFCPPAAGEARKMAGKLLAGFLWHLAEPRERSERLARLHNHVARILAEAPEELCKEVESAVTGFVNRLAEEYGTERETEFEVLWTKAWNSKGEGGTEMREPLTDALNHPAGSWQKLH